MSKVRPHAQIPISNDVLKSPSSAVAIPAVPPPDISSPIGASSNALGCLKRGFLTNVTGCRPLLNKITTYPQYKVPQWFEEHKSPKEPLAPPFGLKVKGASCTLQIGCGGRPLIDKFSWRDVRAVATEIVEDCQPPRGGGQGGTDNVGPKAVWVVAVLGVDPNEYATLNVGEIPDGDDAYFYPLSQSPTGPLIGLGENSSSALDVVQTT